jgi:hypothetical protein
MKALLKSLAHLAKAYSPKYLERLSEKFRIGLTLGSHEWSERSQKRHFAALHATKPRGSTAL